MAELCDVVIATRNRPEPLAQCLEALREQTRRDFGVIVVDDASDSPAQAVVDSVDLDWLEVTVVRFDRQSGPAAARNAGVAASTARFIAFIDDDVRADKRLMETHLVAVMESPEGPERTVSCGPFFEPGDWDPTPWNLWEARQARYEAECMLRGLYKPSWRQCHTGNNLLSRETFLAVGGFHESLRRAEDDELALRLHQRGCVFTFQPRAIAWHYSERSLAAWLDIPRAYAECDIAIDRMHPRDGHVARKRAELEERSRMMRAFRRTMLTARIPEVGIRASVLAARVLARNRRTVDLSMMALSAAYDLAYVSTLNRELQRHPTADQPGAKPSLGPNTVAD